MNSTKKYFLQNRCNKFRHVFLMIQLQPFHWKFLNTSKQPNFNSCQTKYQRNADFRLNSAKQWRPIIFLKSVLEYLMYKYLRYWLQKYISV